MTKITIHNATDKQLRTFLETTCGVPPIHPNTGRKTLLDKLATVHQGDTIDVEDQKPDNVVTLPKEIPAAIARSDGHALGGMSSREAPKVTVMIFAQPGAIGTQHVVLGWNTKVMLVERGKPQPIPYPYYEILVNAQETQVEQDA